MFSALLMLLTEISFYDGRHNCSNGLQQDSFWLIVLTHFIKLLSLSTWVGKNAQYGKQGSKSTKEGWILLQPPLLRAF